MKEIIKKLIETHHALYRVTDLLPVREPMRKMLHENANTLLIYMVGECEGNNRKSEEFRIKISAKIEVMRQTLSAVKELGYCHPVNFEVLEREYKEIGAYFEKIPAPSLVQEKKEDDFVKVFESGVVIEKKEPKEPFIQEQTEMHTQISDTASNERQQAIISFIKERKEVRSTELATIFSNRFSLKTLQRDLAALIGQKVIDKQGEKRWAVYRINGFH